MEDPKVPFADTTARRAQLMAATEQFKTSITDGVEGIKDDAAEIGKTTAFVAGAALAVYLVINAILPKSDEYRYAEKYGEPDGPRETMPKEEEEDDQAFTHRQTTQVHKAAKEIKQNSSQEWVSRWNRNISSY